MARAWGDVPLGDLLSNEARRFGRHTTLVVITPSTDERWVAAMAMLQSRGVKVAAIVLEPSTFGGEESSLGVFASLAAADVFTYMVKHADDLQSALGAELIVGVAREVRQLAMREANWDEIFQRRSYDDASLADERLSSIVPWEDWLTFAHRGHRLHERRRRRSTARNWVRDMPSLYPIGFSALIVGYAALARCACNELLLHPIALLARRVRSSSSSCSRSCSTAARSTLRTDNMLDRMYVWWSAVTQGGISSDPLPVIVLLLVADVARRVRLGVGDLPLAQPVAGPGARRHRADVEHQLHPGPVQLRVRRLPVRARCCC